MLPLVYVTEGLFLFQIFESLNQAPYVYLTKAQRVALATILFK